MYFAYKGTLFFVKATLDNRKSFCDSPQKSLQRVIAAAYPYVGWG